MLHQNLMSTGGGGPSLAQPGDGGGQQRDDDDAKDDGGEIALDPGEVAELVAGEAEREHPAERAEVAVQVQDEVEGLGEEVHEAGRFLGKGALAVGGRGTAALRTLGDFRRWDDTTHRIGNRTRVRRYDMRPGVAKREKRPTENG